MVAEGTFREDLFYRINVIPIRVPPLRERQDDIPLLAEHFVARFAEQMGKPVTGISQDAMQLLLRYDWPGNIRELENVLERTILFTKGDRIERSDLQLAGANDPASHAHPPIATATTTGPIPPITEDDLDDSIAPGEHAGSQSGSLKDIVRAETSRVERELIVKALDETGGNVTQAARLLKISRKSLQMKMKEFGLRDKEA